VFISLVHRQVKCKDRIWCSYKGKKYLLWSATRYGKGVCQSQSMLTRLIPALSTQSVVIGMCPNLVDYDLLN